MINSFCNIRIVHTMRHFRALFIPCQMRECWNDLLHTKFEEPKSNTDIYGEKTEMIRLYRKNTILLILKTSLSLIKMSYVPILNGMIILSIPHYYLIRRL